MKRTIILLLGVYALSQVLLGRPVIAYGDYRDDIGFGLLASELGTGVPDGSGVYVTQVEALSNDRWLPNLEDSQFIGKAIQDMSTEHPTGYSGHANTVGQLFYGSTSSMAPGITAIDSYVAGYGTDHPYWEPPPWQWLGKGFLWFGWTMWGRPLQPLYDMPASPNCNSHSVASPARVANHSWVGTSSSSDMLRRVDWVIDTDEFIQVVASHTSSPVLSAGFNVIAVGRTSGENPAGSPSLDDPYVAGRARPSLVAPKGSLSAATPVVAAAASLLVEVGHEETSLSSDPAESWTYNRDGAIIYNGERTEVVKATLMAGADRFTQNTSTSDNIDKYGQTAYQTDNGLDGRYGAGQVNIYNSYQILAGGEQNSAEDDPQGAGAIYREGFDFDPSFGVHAGHPDTASYHFTSDEAHCRLAASLVWNLRIDGGSCRDFDGSATLYDLNLYLYDITNPSIPQLVAGSTGSTENTENIWIALPKNRNYRLAVSPAPGQGDFTWDYALAWRITNDGDRDGIADYWELEQTLDPEDPTDSDGDPDMDGLNNVEEFACQTDPSDNDTDDDQFLDGEERSYWLSVDCSAFGCDTCLTCDLDGDGQANNLLDVDADGDGWPDGQDSDPSNATPPAVPAAGPCAFWGGAVLLATAGTYAMRKFKV